MIRKICLYGAFSLSLLILMVVSVFSQTVTGTLVGRIEDNNGAAVPGARVVVIEVNRNTTRETTTNDDGNFTLSSVDPGIYRVEIEQTNFKKTVQNNVEVAINSTVRVDAKLEIGGVNEVVEVESESVQLKTDRADVSTQITSDQIEELPLSEDRNYQSVLDISPGVTDAAEVGSSFGNPNGSLVSRVNGQNERYNNFQLDGTINNQTNVISQTAIVPNPEAVEVVDISTNAYDAEQGRAAGGVVNVQIKSGTNRFKGSAWAYNTNSYFKARNSLSTLDVPVTNLNQFGGTFGGPIIKNKTFFFVNFQRSLTRRGQNTLLTVPIAEVRGGNFSSLVPTGTVCPATGTVPAGATCIYDPGTNGLTTGGSRPLFAGNIIPTNRINPAAARLLAMLPLPNRPGLVDNYETAGTFKQDRDSFDVKINHNFTDSTTAFVRYSLAKFNTEDLPSFGDLGGPDTNGVATAAVGPGINHSVSANLTHAFSSRLITEFRFGYVGVHITGEPVSQEGLGNSLGIPNTNTAGDFFTAVGIPRIAISGFTTLGFNTNLPFDITEKSFNIVNNWTVTRGNHTIRFGADLRKLSLDKLQGTGAVNGQYSFTGGLTTRSGTGTNYNAFAAFLLGLPQTVTRNEIVKLGGYTTPQYFFFGQDRWQVSPKLTINYGLRWEIYPYPSGKNPGDQSYYDPATNKAIISGYGPNDDRLNIKTQFSNFAPRVGIAYRFLEKTVARTGYGISYVPITLNTLANQNYGSQLNLSITGTTASFVARDANGNPITLSTGIPAADRLDLTSGIVTPPNNVTVGVVNPNAKRGYIQSYNFTVERDFWGYIASVGYVGSRGTHLPGTVNLNSSGPGTTTADLPFNKLYGRTAQVLLSDFMLSNAYHSLQATLNKRFRRIGGKYFNGTGNITMAYTFAKSLDYTDAFSLDNDLIYDLNRGPSSFDRKHNLVISHVLSPFGNPRKFFTKNGFQWKALVSGFTLSGVFSARSGTPIDVSGSTGAGTLTQGSLNRPDQLAPITYLGGLGPGQLFFDRSVFVNPATGQFGNTSRNSLRGPSYFNYNATLARSFVVNERVKLQASMAVFNVTNTPHYANPNGGFSTSAASSFGTSVTTFGERRIRFGLRATF